MKLGLGVCARDEGATVTETLASLLVALNRVREAADWSIIVCVNGSSDDTASLAEKWIRAQSNPSISLRILEEANLVEAQRLIARCHSDAGADVIGFFDADIVVHRDCILTLLRAMFDPKEQVAYATSVPFKSSKGSLVRRILDQYDRDEIVFSQRVHLHGRAFLIKEWHIPRTSPPLLADVIFLSCHMLSRHGAESIVKCEAARVYFHQLTTVGDFYSAYRRRQLEFSKCLRLFPQFVSLPREYLNRNVNLRGLLSEPPQALTLWMTFFLLRLGFRIRLSLEILGGGARPAWRITKSSKKPFGLPAAVFEPIHPRTRVAESETPARGKLESSTNGERAG
jgi:glycosyltransferase involved in cell wall biosynthesis